MDELDIKLFDLMPLPKGLGLSRTMPFNPIRKGCFWLWNIQEGALGDMLAFEHTFLPLLRPLRSYELSYKSS